MKSKKILQMTPYILVGVILCVTWFKLITTDITATIKHYSALIAFVGNGLLYLIKFRLGIVVTGVLLAVATFNIVALFAVTTTHSYFIRFGSMELAFPSIQRLPLLIFAIYLTINYRYITGGIKSNK